MDEVESVGIESAVDRKGGLEGLEEISGSGLFVGDRGGGE